MGVPPAFAHERQINIGLMELCGARHHERSVAIQCFHRMSDRRSITAGLDCFASLATTPAPAQFKITSSATRIGFGKQTQVQHQPCQRAVSTVHRTISFAASPKAALKASAAGSPSLAALGAVA